MINRTREPPSQIAVACGLCDQAIEVSCMEKRSLMVSLAGLQSVAAGAHRQGAARVVPVGVKVASHSSPASSHG
jgi:hypothetical protein